MGEITQPEMPATIGILLRTLCRWVYLHAAKRGALADSVMVAHTHCLGASAPSSFSGSTARVQTFSKETALPLLLCCLFLFNSNYGRNAFPSFATGEGGVCGVMHFYRDMYTFAFAQCGVWLKLLPPATLSRHNSGGADICGLFKCYMRKGLKQGFGKDLTGPSPPTRRCHPIPAKHSRCA